MQSLCRLSSTGLQRVARGSARWSKVTLDDLNNLMMVVEERLFPGYELAAAMTATVLAAGGDGSGRAADLEASDPASAAEGCVEAGKEGKGAAKTALRRGP